MNEFPAQQGWQCPVCGRVYAPWMAQCLSCDGKRMTYASATNYTTEMTYEEFLEKLSKSGIQKQTEK